MFIGVSFQSQEICNNNIDDDGLIDIDDPQYNASSGIDGGLEFNRRLSNAISLRKYNTDYE